MSEIAFKQNFPDKPKSRFEFNFRNREVIFEIDQLASKSDKSIICRYGNTTVLTVLTVKPLTKKVNSFFPLTITFEEKFYAVGRIPNVFGKREGKPSYDAITAARLIDRSLRSFFPFPSQQEVQIANSVLSFDPDCDPRVVSIWNSFLVSYLCPELPFFATPLAAVIVGQEEKKFISNPSREKLDNFPLELIVSASEEKITMLEAGAQEISETELTQAITFAHQEIKVLIGFFQHIANSLGVKKEQKLVQSEKKDDEQWLEEKGNFYLGEVLLSPHLSWIEKEKKMKEVRQQLTQEYCVQNPQLEEEFVKDLVEEFWDDYLRNWMRRLWQEKRVRLDGRNAEQIRPLNMQIDYLPNVHSSAVFARGETKVLSVITIGKISEKQLVDSIFNRSYKHFIHHYNFPGFAVNEIASYRAVSRREIGHGELVEKTFDFLIPAPASFPYTVRAVSEVLSSDGSSSQASICATSLSLMTAGVPLIRPAAGIALGLFEGQIYSDINGLEDKLGEMDFKIAGTEKGICSIQLDVKNQGISQELIKSSLTKAHQARMYLLEEMKKYIHHPRPHLPTQVIKCCQLPVPKEKIGLIIGPRGKTINQLTEETGSTIEVQADGCVLIYHQEEDQLEKTCQAIKKIIRNG
ncbi:Polyribonucleotide nucleotidyltransferase [endosymbiont DhMRE of Dentiscutata heterogama]|uniref:polyribonucleotide nucleotidyltransferase n=1 Tax=endosymbiont DhMRE of Dentiscutata heterogama TaxID=1609546 RepID=UPI000629D40B|nr:polyribonucleotide nucleotidyltransferase [endosymbiont DhMRE of Dentiscutata heterogama]CFW92766.1 Polyribonucleotide nucleotidyltransferase [endosymbiont DhMRE of Dentiscutata heterogama]